jgi:hypothetical protein
MDWPKISTHGSREFREEEEKEISSAAPICCVTGEGEFPVMRTALKDTLDRSSKATWPDS